MDPEIVIIQVNIDEEHVAEDGEDEETGNSDDETE